MTLIADPEEWQPRLVGFAAAGPQHFAVALRQPGFDDTFSVILEYDGRFDQPWTRVEADGAVLALAYGTVSGTADPVAFALTEDGEVFTLIPGQVSSDKIVGAGLNTTDADGRGAVYDIAHFGASTFVVGAGRQLYERPDGAGWITHSADNTPQPGYLPEDFGHLAVMPNGNLLISTHQRPGTPVKKSLVDDPRFSADMPPADLMALMEAVRKEEQGGQAPLTRLLHGPAGDLTRLEVASDALIRGLHVEPDNTIWVFGVDGLILSGTVADGLSRRDFHGDTQTLIAAARFGEDMIFASDYGLHRFNGHMLSPVKPKLDPTVNDATPTPLALQSFGKTMLYADYKHGVLSWDGNTWVAFDIPTALTRRAFTGLQD